jgi:hypothetical protein
MGRYSIVVTQSPCFGNRDECVDFVWLGIKCAKCKEELDRMEMDRIRRHKNKNCEAKIPEGKLDGKMANRSVGKCKTGQ